MSLPLWLYPLSMLWLLTQFGAGRSLQFSSNKGFAWDALLDSFFFLPWVLVLFIDDALAAWVGFELIGCVVIGTILKQRSTPLLREAWIKVSVSWILSSLLMTFSVYLSGVSPLPDGMLFPLSGEAAETARPVLAIILFCLSFSLKLGLPPFQQGIVDIMEVVGSDQHKRLALPLRFCFIFSVWQFYHMIVFPLTASNRLFFMSLALLGVLASAAVASVQASIARTLAYLGTISVVPLLISPLLIEESLGFSKPIVTVIWLNILASFLSLSQLYSLWHHSASQACPEIWTDIEDLMTWKRRLNQWGLISLVQCMLLAGVLIYSGQLWIALLTLLIGIAHISSCYGQLGIVASDRKGALQRRYS